MTASNFQPPGYTPSRRGPNPVIFIGAILVALLLIGGGLAWLLRIGPFAQGPTNSASPTLTAGPSAPASGQPPTTSRPRPPTAQPSGDGLPSPTVELTAGPPNDDTARLLTHVPEAVRGSCVPGAFAEPVLARVDCTPAPDISVYYAIYANLADATDAYDRAFGRALIDRDSGRCYNENADGTLTATTDAWPSEHEYTQEGQSIGRFLCNVDEPPSITWTDDRLYILAVATSPTGDSDRLVSFWAKEAGPVP